MKHISFGELKRWLFPLGGAPETEDLGTLILAHDVEAVKSEELALAKSPDTRSFLFREALIGLQLRHETSYQQEGDGSWGWRCRCGVREEIFSTAAGCHRRTREHGADAVLSLVAGQLAPDAKGPAGAAPFIKCQYCDQPASFIINGVAVCTDCRGNLNQPGGSS